MKKKYHCIQETFAGIAFATFEDIQKTRNYPFFGLVFEQVRISLETFSTELLKINKIDHGNQIYRH